MKKQREKLSRTASAPEIKRASSSSQKLSIFKDEIPQNQINQSNNEINIKNNINNNNINDNNIDITMEKKGFLLKRGGKNLSKWQKRYFELIYSKENKMYLLSYRKGEKVSSLYLFNY